jgi:hypothetical protein
MTEQKRGPGRPKSSTRASRPTRKTTLADAHGHAKLGVVNPEPGYKYYVENDDGDKIAKRQSLGWEVVESGNEAGTYMGAINPKEVGTAVQTTVNPWGTKGVLMKQREEWWQEDQDFKAKQIDKSEEALFRKLKEEEGRTGDIKKDEKPLSRP